MIRTLARTDQPVWTYVAKAALLTLIPSLVISAVVETILPDEGPTFDGPVIVVVVGVLVLSPWIETLLMWPILGLLRRFVRKRIPLAVGSAMVWALLHSLAAPAWGLIIAWPFFVLSLCFIAWEEKSVGRAIVVTALVHTCHNVIPTIALLLSP